MGIKCQSCLTERLCGGAVPESSRGELMVHDVMPLGWSQRLVRVAKLRYMSLACGLFWFRRRSDPQWDSDWDRAGLVMVGFSDERTGLTLASQIQVRFSTVFQVILRN